jgi:predicted acyl esterase
MLVSWDVPIQMDDGLKLRADVYAPVAEGKYPAILSYGPYGKGLAFQEAYPAQWEKMVADFPDVAAGSTNKYQSWEVADPEKWVSDGYVCVRVDSRGAGRSPGIIDIWSPRETRDFYECIEWAAAQPWSNGKVGLAGISYYAMNQYQVAALQPPHLAAICPWEGSSDWYREFSYNGGIYSEFCGKWYPRQVDTVQYGVGERGYRSSMDGELVAGPETLSEEELVRNRVDPVAEIRKYPLVGKWHTDRSPDWSKVRVPMLSAANWGGHGLHARGNFEAFGQAASGEKWLEVHGDAHWALFYTDYGVELQKRFFGHFLKGEDTGWGGQSRVQLQVRHVDGSFRQRQEDEWPLARSVWTKYYLHLSEGTLGTSVPKGKESVSYGGLGDGITFTSAPLAQEMEITGPMAAKLFASSSTADADFFLVLRVFDPQGREVTFMGALDPNTPVAQGWLRASHRKLDPKKSLPYRPYHTHDEIQPLTPGQAYELDVEVWPTSIVIPAGYRLALTVRGKDYEYEGELTEFAQSFHYANQGVGPFEHKDPDDRPESVFGGTVTLHSDDGREPYLLLPVIPERG